MFLPFEILLKIFSFLTNDKKSLLNLRLISNYYLKSIDYFTINNKIKNNYIIYNTKHKVPKYFKIVHKFLSSQQCDTINEASIVIQNLNYCKLMINENIKTFNFIHELSEILTKFTIEKSNERLNCQPISYNPLKIKGMLKIKNFDFSAKFVINNPDLYLTNCVFSLGIALSSKYNKQIRNCEIHEQIAISLTDSVLRSYLQFINILRNNTLIGTKSKIVDTKNGKLISELWETFNQISESRRFYSAFFVEDFLFIIYN